MHGGAGDGEAGRSDDDRDLVDRARRGDTDAFAGLVRKYQHRIVNLARVLTSRSDDAEDVAQEVFLRVYRGLSRFRAQSSFKTWLYQIATNTARTHLGRRLKQREEQDDPERPSLAERPSAENVERAVEDRDRIDRALASLPQELREAVVLRDVEGLDYREIAAALDVPIGTVESRIFRGRARLRIALGARTATSNDGERS